MSLPVFTVGELCRLAYRLAGLKNPHQTLSTVEMSDAKMMLKGIVRSHHARGHFARTITTELIQLEAGEYVYTMDEADLDIVGAAMFVHATTEEEAATSNATSIVRMMGRDEWQVAASRGISGIPSRYFPDRTEDIISVYVTPTPSASEADKFIRFQVHRLRQDVSDENAALDFEPYWVDQLGYALAEKLADGAVLNPNRIGRFERKATQLLDEAKAQSKQRKRQRMVVRHRTPWSR
jgi:hypothetical protein